MTPTRPTENSVEILSRAEWRRWLLENHARATGVWLITHKKRPGAPHVPNGELVEEALCFGWVDSLPRKLDLQRTMLWFAPRKRGSGWSKVNKEHITRLLAAGRMHRAGLTKIEAAKRDGSWKKLDAIETLATPADLSAAFALHPGSATHFEAFPRSAKRGILEWIAQARQPATRAQRIEETASLAAKNERANQWKPKK